ncbi:MAG: glycosyltransferase family 4 protein, partial [Atribacterota bacterium]
MKKYKLAILVSHPIQYQVPLYKKLAEHPKIDLMVYYCTDYGIKEKKDPGFGIKFKWDIPLLEEYNYKFLPNISLKPSNSFFGQINPSIIIELYKNEYDAIIIHGWSSFANILGIIGAKMSNTKIILKGEGDNLKNISNLIKIIKNLIYTLFFKIPNAFLYSYNKNKEYFKSYGVKEKKLFFFPCAVDNDLFQNELNKYESSRDKIKKKMGIDSKDIIILFVGKLIKRKRPIDLLKAFKNIRKDNENVSLLFVGDGEQKDELENYINNNKLKKIYFSGFINQSEISKYYSIGDIVVLPSEYDPSPKAVNEAMNFKLPLILSNKVGTAYDLVK